MNLLFALAALATISQVHEATPNRQPQIAAGNGVVAMVFGNGRSVLFSKSTDNGATFSKPETIAELPILPLTRHRGPRVAFAGKTLLVTAIGGEKLATGPHAHGLPQDGDLRAWRSTDNGKTWSKSVVINDAPGAAREGLHAMSADADGNAAAVWLDLRQAGTRLFGAWSSDGGSTWSKNKLLYESPDGTICQCCHPSLLALGNGEFAVMFRNALAGSRDMYLLKMKNGNVTAPSKLGSDTWEINACPMDGGGLARSGSGMITAWRRDSDVYLAAPGEQERKIGTGKDIALATHGNRIFAIWTQVGKIEAWISGKPEILSNNGAFPTLAPLADGSVMAAWEEDGAITLRRLK
jgi:hypothetical protein